jgi:hypothetical protein
MLRTRADAPPLATSLAALLDRDLAALRREVEAYPDERDLWRAVPGIPNVAGTLVLHLAGNLQHYIGACLGNSGYVRDRPAEFARRDVPRSELLNEIEAARAAVRAGLSAVTEEQLVADFRETISGSRVVTSDYLVHLAAHFAFHLGQVDYHRRVVTGSDQGVGAMRPTELGSVRPSPDR